MLDLRSAIDWKYWAALGTVLHAKQRGAGGDHARAIEMLNRANNKRFDAAFERELIKQRYKAAQKGVQPQNGLAHVKPAPPSQYKIQPNELSASAVAGAIAEYGFVWIEQLLTADQIKTMQDATDKAMAARAAGDTDSAWYQPSFAISKEFGEEAKKLMVNNDTVWMFESPRAVRQWLEILEESSLLDAICTYFACRPFLSLRKTTMRRVSPTADHPFGWHQDGAFLGENCRTLNCWAALSDCGRSAPGLEFVPRSIPLAPTGEAGSIRSWAIAAETVKRLYGDEVIRPEFKAGDVLLFDQLFLHRTAQSAEMTKQRYAVESWFFAPDSMPEGYVPFLV